MSLSQQEAEPKLHGICDNHDTSITRLDIAKQHNQVSSGDAGSSHLTPSSTLESLVDALIVPYREAAIYETHAQLPPTSASSFPSVGHWIHGVSLPTGPRMHNVPYRPRAQGIVGYHTGQGIDHSTYAPGPPCSIGSSTGPRLQHLQQHNVSLAAPSYSNPGVTGLVRTDNPPMTGAVAKQPAPRYTNVLGALEIASIAPAEAVFTFGVLSVHERLAPKFEYLEYFDHKWVVKLSFAGHTVSRLEVYDTKAAAMAGACRDALAALKAVFPNWTVPDTPEMNNVTCPWPWSTTLQDYCEQNNINQPVYTQYSHDHGFRYEAEVAGLCYFGTKKFYATAAEAIHGCAHHALYSLILVSADNGGPWLPNKPKQSESPQGNMVETALSKLRDMITRETFTKGQTLGKIGPAPKSYGDPSTRARKRRGRRGRGMLSSGNGKNVETKASEIKKQPPVSPSSGKLQSKPMSKAANSRANAPQPTPKGNPNYAPIPQSKRRTQQPITSSNSPVKSTFICPQKLRVNLSGCQTDMLRVEKVCQRMNIDVPEFRAIKLETEGHVYYDVAAYFHHQPYFARVGAIGRINKAEGPVATAKEACAKKVVQYLLDVIEEDNRLEMERSGVQKMDIDG